MKLYPTDMDEIEKEIVERISAAKTRLRFDRVAQRLSHNLKAALESIVPDGQSVLLTISAPIIRPSATAAVLELRFSDGTPDREIKTVIHGNHVRVLTVTGVAAYMPKVIVLVHNPQSDPGAILAMAKSRLLARHRPGFGVAEKPQARK